MEKDTPHSAASPSAGDAPYLLPSTFSPWRNHEEFVGEDNISIAPSNDERRSSSIETLRGYPPPHADETENSRPPVFQQSSFFRSSKAAGTQSEDEELMLRPDDHGMQPKTEVVITAGDSTQEKRGATRRTRFKEMLSRSLSATLLNKNESSPPNGNYDSIGEEPPAAAMHHRTESYPMQSVDLPRVVVAEERPSSSDSDDDIDLDGLAARYERPPLDCHARQDVYVKRRSWTYIVLAALSVYSTLLSGLWFVVSIVQPRYGKGVSSNENIRISPSTATLICTLIAKTIELSFVTVFVAFIGQVLTRRAFVKKAGGVTLAEMTMRNWVIQPGSLLTYWEGIPFAAPTLLGMLTLIATVCAMFYTTASDAMVSPKLKYGGWESRSLDGLVKASYANPFHVQKACLTPIDANLDDDSAAESCLDIQYSGQSYHNLFTFMGEWQAIHSNKTSTMDTLSSRPVGKHNLYDNTTMVSSWIETGPGNPQAAFAIHSRVINNVTLAMPHPGIYTAATDPKNEILQPEDLAGVGEYSIHASVVSPAVNVLCANMAADELAPLVYTRWPDARTEDTDYPSQKIGVEDWFNDVPPPTENQWLNRTAADDVFRWGPKYQRRPPVFQLYPIDYNMITNTSVAESDAIYILAKSGNVDDYTLCEMRSWVTPKCSTQFDLSGISGGTIRAHCEDQSDKDSYIAGSGNDDVNDPPYASVDWRNLADEWRLSMDLNGGVQNNNASNARIMTNFILEKPELNPLLPSMAEALAVLASSTLVAGSLSSTFRQRWDYQEMDMADGVYESFHVSMRTQQYTSSHVQAWQAVFYVVLGLVLLINIACLLYILFYRTGLVSDYTEPQNLFALTLNSPPSAALAGSCGHGPDSAEMVVPWRVAYSSTANHYFFEEACDCRKLGMQDIHTHQSFASGAELLSPHSRSSAKNFDNYKRLSGSKTWL
ncbi:hypothetical protein M426DRAFT_25589 [Hypoxylon sp. CI-4A]|nr:hypothetical protein M426DRAFT_25589 [Hypoxylon sp. CI-4A]